MQGQEQFIPPHDIHGLLPYVASLPWGFIAAIVLLATLVGVFFWWRRRRPGKDAAIPEKIKDPYEALLESLMALTVPTPFEGKARGDYYFGVSFILRSCIELRTGLNCTDLTYNELEGPVKRHLPVAQGVREDVLELLKLSDLVKYADLEVSVADAEHARERALSLMRILRPAPAESYPADHLLAKEAT